MRINELAKYTQDISPLYKPNLWNFPKYPDVDKIEYLIKMGKFETENVDPQRLISNQKFINTEMVAKYIENENLGITRTAAYHQYPIVVDYANNYYLFAGNHRAVAALEARRKLPVRVIDYNSL